MFPFGGILSSASQALLLPGEITPATFARQIGGGATPYSGLRFNINGQLQARGAPSGTYVDALTESWIHTDARPGLVAGIYEARFDYQSGSGIGQVQGSAEGTWITINPSQPEWFVTSPSNFVTITIQGLLSVREILNPGNVKVGDVTIRAFNEGP